MSKPLFSSLILLAVASVAAADPCGMVPPIYTGPGQPITRIGLQQTYVFHKDGVETFVIRPGFTGKVDEFGMLIPFPKPPAVRKVPDHIFPHLAAAVDPPEVVINLQWERLAKKSRRKNLRNLSNNQSGGLEFKRDEVRVVKQEAVGMYEVAVLEAGSAAALKKWMDQHGYQYPDGMDGVCEEYVKDRWCFVAVKTRVGQKEGVDPAPGQRDVASKLPIGSTFDGHVQAMGFRFESDELVVPMRLSSFNEGELRNIVYLLTDGPRKVNSIPEEYVVRQVSGEQLFGNVTDPLPLRIIGGTEADLQPYHKTNLAQRRNPTPHNGAAKELFAGDLKAINSGELSLPHEEKEKELLNIGERLGLRGKPIDDLHATAVAELAAKSVADALVDVKNMSLTVVDGDFPREVLSRKNLTFGEYRMPSRRNKAENYDAKLNRPAGPQGGTLILGSLESPALENDTQTAAHEATGKAHANLSSLVSRVSNGLALLGVAFVGLGLFWQHRRAAGVISLAIATVLTAGQPTQADPCGMVPPIYTGPGQPITRIGLQQTYVFHKDGVETFVIRPGFQGKVDEFGMLIPFPSVPAIRKVPDHIFPHLAAAVDPPEVVVDLNPRPVITALAAQVQQGRGQKGGASFRYRRDQVVVVKQEAVGMYEVAVLEAGSAAALKRWMDEHGYKFPEGMDSACEDYVGEGWCFVAVKTKVGQKAGVEPEPGQREVQSKLPTGSTFDGHVQAMGFRFKVDELIVPMRLSTFNGDDTRNVVYLLTEGPRKISSIPEEYVVRQISGEALHRNVTGPLPLRILGGTEADLTDWHRKSLPAQRNPEPKNGAAKALFASDLKAVVSGNLTLPHEEKEKELLAIGEALGLRGGQIDKLHTDAIAELSRKSVDDSINELAESMTLTVVDGDFPRAVLSEKNLQFAEYKMPARRNKADNYDAKLNGPGPKNQSGVLKLGSLDAVPPPQAVPAPEAAPATSIVKQFSNGLALLGLTFVGLGLFWQHRRAAGIISLAVATVLTAGQPTQADPCGMVPPIYTGPGQPITRIGLQQTYVFHKDGVETFVIRPGFQGKVDEFGMLIPFPSVPAIRKVPDHIFPHLAAAVDPPEVVVDLRPQPLAATLGPRGGGLKGAQQGESNLRFQRDKVVVVKQEAVGMYEVAVLEAGSAAALKKWMDQHGYKYPDGMDAACEDYVDDGWCFVAVKTRVGQKKGVEPEPGQRKVESKLPQGSTFDGHVQAMGFRFEVDELIVPMRLSTFNGDDTRNIVYLLTEGPRKISSIPEEYVVRQISGSALHRNVTGPLPLRIIGGTEADLGEWHRKNLPAQRNPEPKNGAAKALFASDLKSVASGTLTLPHEEKEKELLNIGEHLGLRGGQIDSLHQTAIAELAKKSVDDSIRELADSMTLTVVDGDFPRAVLSEKNLSFAEYKMPARRNKADNYDAKVNGPGPQNQRGVLKLGSLDPIPVRQDALPVMPEKAEKGPSIVKRFSAGLALLGLTFVGLGLFWQHRRAAGVISVAIATLFTGGQPAQADPCGMVPPIYTGPGQPITRIGLQQTYVFHKDGVETFVIRPGFQGKVDQFGMLIPFPSVPAIRKVPDHIFPHLAAAVDPPEVVVDLRPVRRFARGAVKSKSEPTSSPDNLKFRKDQVRVIKQEAVGMYEVAVLEAGSSAALKKWMTQHGYQYPKGMDGACDDYVEEGWCFVAVKTRVGQKEGVEPTPGQRKVKPQLPQGSTFDGHVQAMGFRFKVDELIVPMRLSTFNGDDTRNIVYLLTDGPRKISSIPEEYVVRQISGAALHRNLTGPLPLRIIGGTEADLSDWHRKNLPQQRNPEPKNGAAKALFAGDLKAVGSGNLSLPHEEKEKELLSIGEALGLRGGQIDKLHADAVAELGRKSVDDSINELAESMTLTVVDGDFPRAVLSEKNLSFAEYQMPARRNKPEAYDAKLNAPAPKKQGVLKLGSLPPRPKVQEAAPSPPEAIGSTWSPLKGVSSGLALLGFALVGMGLFWQHRRTLGVISLATATVLTGSQSSQADPCGMVPPIYTGPGQPITRIGLQQTYVFYKDGVETFVIRPGFEGKVDEFGMLIPFPSVPAIRKVPDHIFPHLAAAVDPPEVVVDLRPQLRELRRSGRGRDFKANNSLQFAAAAKETVRVIKQEAVGMYEVAVLEAGSAAALKKWMDQHGYKYPDGMDGACEDYVEEGWCFVAVKTRVGQKGGVDPVPGQRKVQPKLPTGSTFDGHVQAMGFRFKVDELVVPMRLSTFNGDDTRNVVYLLTDGPRKISSIPEEYVVRQISGDALHRNVTGPLPLRILGGTEADLTERHLKSLRFQRIPEHMNGAAKNLFAGDLKAVASGELSLAHEEKEKELLSIGEALGLRGAEIDKLHETSVADMAAKAAEQSLADLKETMTLTVVDGDFPRAVLSEKNLSFGEYRMPSRRNTPTTYDAKLNAPGPQREGLLKLGAIEPPTADRQQQGVIEGGTSETQISGITWPRGSRTLAVLLPFAALIWVVARRGRQK